MENQKKINREGVISETVTVNNQCDTLRCYDISANATYSNGSLTNVDSGTVTALDGGASVATFSRYSESSLFISFTTNVGRSAVLFAVEDFVANLNDVANG